MNPILKKVASFLQREGIPFTQNRDKSQIHVTVKCDDIEWYIFIAFHEANNLFTVCSDLGICVPEDLRKEVIEFIARANWGLQGGQFQIDSQKGRVFLSFTQLATDSVEDWIIERMFHSVFENVDRYGPGLYLIIRERWTAEKSYFHLFGDERCEGETVMDGWLLPPNKN